MFDQETQIIVGLRTRRVHGDHRLRGFEYDDGLPRVFEPGNDGVAESGRYLQTFRELGLDGFVGQWLLDGSQQSLWSL